MRASVTMMLLFCACQETKTQPAASPPPSAPAAAAPAAAPSEPKDPDAKTYEVKGTVKELGPEPKSVTIAHEKIPGFMDAMTMPFPVADAALLNGIQAGDAVTFTLEYKNGITKITRLQK